MQKSRPAPVWAGRGLAVVGLVVLALNLRSAVAVFSPIVDEVGADLALTTASVGVIGMLPPVCFALFGLLAPTVARRAGLELTVLCAIVGMTVGHLARGLSGSVEMFGVATAVTLAGMGFGNVLMPPLIKRYFPDRIGLFTSVTTVMLSISTGVPTLVAAPLADSVGWRVAIGSWAALALIALVPWVALLVQHRRRMRREAAPELAGATSGPVGRAWRSPVAWAIMIVQAASSFNAYAMFAWLPLLLVDVAGQTPATAGALLSIIGFAGLPTAIVVPFLAVRMRNVGILVQVGVGFFVAGYAGLLLAPATATWLWVLFAGLGPMLFPVTLVLINLRTRTQRGSVVLSGFSQGFGYVVGSLGPLLFGLVHELTGSWQVPLLMLLVPVAFASAAGVYLARPHILEDTWHPKGARD